MKVCKECKIEKEISEYYLRKNGSPRGRLCKSCYLIVYKTDKEYSKRYRDNNSETIKQKMKEFRKNNKELVAERKRKYWDSLSPEKKAEINAHKKELYHENNSYKENKRKYVNNKLETDPFFKLKFNLRVLIRNGINRNFTKKSKKTSDILGCTFEEFKIYLESKFDENMNWENQGTYWHLDHIIPISSAQTEEEVYKLNHYTNFQPLYWLDNLKKSNKINEI
jgi:hypothetical protein